MALRTYWLYYFLGFIFLINVLWEVLSGGTLRSIAMPALLSISVFAMGYFGQHPERAQNWKARALMYLPVSAVLLLMLLSR